VSTIYRPAPVPIDVPSAPAVRLIPLGGLGEIGLNMMLIESGDDVIAVDCGLLFPDDEMPGVDYVIPDFSYLRDRRAAFRGVVLTHGHEDHIGALSYLLRDFHVPVYGTPLTLAIAKHRLAEHGVLEGADLRAYGPGDEIVLGGFTVSPIRVTHSIADGIGLAIETAVGTIVHTGDFKLDLHPVDDQQADYAAFAALGERGVLALCSDSTNVGRPGHTGSETEVGAALDGRFAEAPGRIIVATFASHIHRIQQLLDLAIRYERRVRLLGRHDGNVAVAAGWLPPGPRAHPLDDSARRRLAPDDPLDGGRGARRTPPSRLSGEHKYVDAGPGDLVIFSSRVIPGTSG
jgi:ribonuclease J